MSVPCVYKLALVGLKTRFGQAVVTHLKHYTSQHAMLPSRMQAIVADVGFGQENPNC